MVPRTKEMFNMSLLAVILTVVQCIKGSLIMTFDKIEN